MNTLNKTDFSTNIEVRYQETDAMGIVHHSSYVGWLELSRIQWLKKMDLPYHELEKLGRQIPVLALNIQYKKPLHFGDEVQVMIRPLVEGKMRFKFLYEIFRGEDLVSTAETEHVVLESGKPIRVPDWLRNKF